MDLDKIEQVKKYFDGKNGNTFIYTYLADQYMERGKNQQAKKISRKGLNIHPRDPFGYFIDAIIDKKEGNEKSYIKKLKKCIELDNGFIQAYQELITEGESQLSDHEIKEYYSKLSSHNQVDKKTLQKFAKSGVLDEERKEEQETGLDYSDTGNIDEELEKLDDIDESDILKVAEKEESERKESGDNKTESPNEQTQKEKEEEQYGKFMEEVSQYEDFGVDQVEGSETTSDTEKQEEKSPKKEAEKKLEKDEESDKSSKDVQKKEKSQKVQEKNIRNTEKLGDSLGSGLKSEFQDEEVQKRVEMIADMFNAVNRQEDSEQNPSDFDLGFMQRTEESTEKTEESIDKKSLEETINKKRKKSENETRVEIERKTKNKMEEGPDSVDLKIPVPTMTFVDVLVKQELYDQALDVLDVIKQKREGKEEEIEQKRAKILQLKAKQVDEEDN